MYGRRHTVLAVDEQCVSPVQQETTTLYVYSSAYPPVACLLARVEVELNWLAINS